MKNESSKQIQKQALCKTDVSSSANGKIKGKKYYYMHSGDCIVYVTYCENCKKEVGGWSPGEADKKWSEHCC